MRFIAFWEYDLYPFVLYGTVKHINSDGTVETEEYGMGHRFTPKLLLPADSASTIIADLAKLTQTRHDLERQNCVNLDKLLKERLPAILWRK
jgi:hypothetical protein